MISMLNKLNCVFNSVDLSMDKRGHNVGICQSSDYYNTFETVNTLYMCRILRAGFVMSP